jgi:hypothetical protein
VPGTPNGGLSPSPVTTRPNQVSVVSVTPTPVRKAPAVAPITTTTTTTQAPYYERSQVSGVIAEPLSADEIARAEILAQISGLGSKLIVNGGIFYLKTPLNPPKVGDQIGVYVGDGGYCVVSATFLKLIGPDRCADIEAEALRQQNTRANS